MMTERDPVRVVGRPSIGATAALVVFGTAWLVVGQTPAEEGKPVYRHWAPRDRSDFTKTREDGFPLNVNPKIVSAAEADLGDDDLIMGAVINGEARAYPVNYMNGPHNEVVNDQLGGLPIAPTW